MTKTSTVEYLGELRTQMVHLDSGSIVITDAPKDNQGKGEAFAPTDLVATALASCMISVMGIRARKDAIDIVGTKAEISKVMQLSPRKIASITIQINFPNVYSEKTKKILEKTALACPVSKSFDNDIKQVVTFNYPEN